MDGLPVDLQRDRSTVGSNDVGQIRLGRWSDRHHRLDYGARNSPSCAHPTGGGAGSLVLIVIGIVVILVVAAIAIYNALIQKRLRIDEAFAQIEVQLKRRHDLIPNLVNAVKGYMGFEQKVLTDVTNARAAAVAAGAQGPAQQAAAENALTGSLRSLFAVVENYPDLRRTRTRWRSRSSDHDREPHLLSRQHYNATVLDYNTGIATFPSVLLAGPLGFTRREFFDAEPEAAAVPNVDLSLS